MPFSEETVGGYLSLSVSAHNFSLGTEATNFESLDGTVYERNVASPTVDYGVGVEFAFVVSVHASVSISFSGIVDNFVEYGKKRGWWQ